MVSSNLSSLFCVYFGVHRLPMWPCRGGDGMLTPEHVAEANPFHGPDGPIHEFVDDKVTRRLSESAPKNRPITTTCGQFCG